MTIVPFGNRRVGRRVRRPGLRLQLLQVATTTALGRTGPALTGASALAGTTGATRTAWTTRPTTGTPAIRGASTAGPPLGAPPSPPDVRGRPTGRGANGPRAAEGPVPVVVPREGAGPRPPMPGGGGIGLPLCERGGPGGGGIGFPLAERRRAGGAALAASLRAQCRRGRSALRLREHVLAAAGAVLVAARTAAGAVFAGAIGDGAAGAGALAGGAAGRGAAGGAEIVDACRRRRARRPRGRAVGHAETDVRAAGAREGPCMSLGSSGRLRTTRCSAAAGGRLDGGRRHLDRDRLGLAHRDRRDGSGRDRCRGLLDRRSAHRLGLHRHRAGAAAGFSSAGAAAFFVVFEAALAGLAGFTSSGCSGRISPSRSARRRTRSACASSMLEEWLFTPMPSATERSSVSLLVIPSSLASSWRRIFAGKVAVSLSGGDRDQL